MASSGPLAGPDAKTPAFPTTFFSHERGRSSSRSQEPPAGGAMEERRGEKEDAIYECALAELLDAGVDVDVRTLLTRSRKGGPD